MSRVIELSIDHFGGHYSLEISEHSCIIKVKYPYKETYIEVDSIPHLVCCQVLRQLVALIPPNKE